MHVPEVRWKPRYRSCWLSIRDPAWQRPSQLQMREDVARYFERRGSSGGYTSESVRIAYDHAPSIYRDACHLKAPGAKAYYFCVPLAGLSCLGPNGQPPQAYDSFSQTGYSLAVALPKSNTRMGVHHQSTAKTRSRDAAGYTSWGINKTMGQRSSQAASCARRRSILSMCPEVGPLTCATFFLESCLSQVLRVFSLSASGAL